MAEALSYLHYSNAAYCSEEQLTNWTCLPCRRVPAPVGPVAMVANASTHTHGYVAVTAQEVLVAFRGSHELWNWVYDLTFRKVAIYPLCAGCLVHAGFWEVWQSVREAVLSAVTAKLDASPRARLVVAGHSLGAALAVLCTMELAYLHGINVTALYSFGLPRVGNDAFVANYNRLAHPSWRLTHWRDPVPHLPVHVMGFTHVAREVFYNADSSNYTLCRLEGEDPEGSNRFDLTMHIPDHLSYLGIPTGSAACEMARPVLGAPPPEARERLERRFDAIGRDAEVRDLR